MNQNLNPLTVQLGIGSIWYIVFFVGIALTIIRWVWTMEISVDHPPPRIARIFWIYALLCALFVVEYPALHFNVYTTPFKMTAAQALIEMFFIVSGALLLRKTVIPIVLPYAVAFSLVCVWGNWPGMLGAPSFNSAFAALAVPFLPFYTVIAVVVTVITHHGTTACLILAAQIFARMLKPTKLNWVLASLGILAVLGGSAYFHSGPMFDGAERLVRYREYMAFWAKEPRWILFGVGPGSFVWTSALLDNFKAPLFMQMHSDVLQILWELGAVGLLLGLGTFIVAVKRAWNNPKVLAALFGSVAFMLPYHPLRFYPTALLTAYIWLLALCAPSCKSD